MSAFLGTGWRSVGDPVAVDGPERERGGHAGSLRVRTLRLSLAAIASSTIEACHAMRKAAGGRVCV